MQPIPELKAARFARFAEEKYRQTEGTTQRQAKVPRKIVRRGQHAAKTLRKWLYGGARNITGNIADFSIPLTHEEFIQASHLAFLAHDDARLPWTQSAQKFINDVKNNPKLAARFPDLAEEIPRRTLRSLIRDDLRAHGLPAGVHHLLVESRMVQEDFRKIVLAEETLRRLQTEPDGPEKTDAQKAARQTIQERMAFITAQHPAVIAFNAAQAHSYFFQKRAGQKYNRLGVVYWPLAAMSLYAPYLEKGGLEKQGKALARQALLKAYPGIHQHIENVKRQYRDDMERKKRSWPAAAKKALQTALDADRQRINRGGSPLYPDVDLNRISIEPFAEKSNASLYRTFGSKTPDGAEHYRTMPEVHDIMRSRIIVDNPSHAKAVRACRQIRDAIQNHLNTPVFPLERIRQRKDLLRKGKKNKFRSLILEMHFGGYPENVKGLPRAELQILSRAMHRQNQKPESARTPRWTYFSGIIPNAPIARLLGIPKKITGKNK